MLFKYLTILFFLTGFNQKEFIKNYDNQGNLTSEGWMINNKKTDYWTFYYTNGTIEKKRSF